METEGFFSFWQRHNCLSYLSPLHLNTYGSYGYYYCFFSAGIEFTLYKHWVWAAAGNIKHWVWAAAGNITKSGFVPPANPPSIYSCDVLKDLLATSGQKKNTSSKPPHFYILYINSDGDGVDFRRQICRRQFVGSKGDHCTKKVKY